jgi:hypothetical protein
MHIMCGQILNQLLNTSTAMQRTDRPRLCNTYKYSKRLQQSVSWKALQLNDANLLRHLGAIRSRPRTAWLYDLKCLCAWVIPGIDWHLSDFTDSQALWSIDRYLDMHVIMLTRWSHWVSSGLPCVRSWSKFTDWLLWDLIAGTSGSLHKLHHDRRFDSAQLVIVKLCKWASSTLLKLHVRTRIIADFHVSQIGTTQASDVGHVIRKFR